MDAQAGSLQDRAQISDRGALAIGARDMDHRRQLSLGTTELCEQALDTIEGEIDFLRMQRRQPCDQIAELRLRCFSSSIHASSAGATSGAATIVAGSGTSGAALDVLGAAGDLVNTRNSRAAAGDAKSSSWVYPIQWAAIL